MLVAPDNHPNHHHTPNDRELRHLPAGRSEPHAAERRRTGGRVCRRPCVQGSERGDECSERDGETAAAGEAAFDQQLEFVGEYIDVQGE